MYQLFLISILLFSVTPLAFGQISDRTGLKQDFTIETGGHTFRIDVTSNFNVEDINFSSDDRRLTFYINSGLENNLAEIEIPKNLINGNFTFMLNDQEIFPIVKTNEQISFITMEFQGTGKNKLDILETFNLPESPDITPWVLSEFIILIIVVVLVIVIVAVLVIIFTRKTKKSQITR
ncbi:MAG TPA: hypothetical protein VD731_02740 [Nitrosopumilaceae archaeon]|nr:hypothetical protein [Nitrosopumilaceae archaeon]